VLVGLPDWHQLGQLVMVHVSVVTERDLRSFPELVAQLRRRVDVLFCGSEMPPLGHLRSDRLRTVDVVPPLLDVLAFPPKPEPERTIDIFSPGQRPPGQHRLLQHWRTSTTAATSRTSASSARSPRWWRTAGCSPRWPPGPGCS